MIWTILLIVLITVAALLCIVVSLILFPVFTLGIYAVLRPGNKKVEIEGSWLHPWIVTFALNPFSKEFTLRFMGRRLFGSKSKHPSAESETVSQPESSSAKSEPGTRQDVPSTSNGIDEFEVVSSRHEPEVRSEREIHTDDKSEEIPFFAENPTEEKVEAEEKNKKKKKVEAERKARKEAKTKDKAEKKIKDAGVEGEKAKGGFFGKLKKNRYFYMIRQRKLQKKLFGWGFRIFRSLFKIIRFNHFDASIKAGIEEPALLGNVYAFYTMTRYTVNVSEGEPIVKFEPVFMKNWFEGEGRFSVKTSVFSLMWPGFLAVSSFPYITVLWLFWKSRKLKAKTDKKS